MDYKDTLKLPKTDFPMRANLPKKEPEILEKWETIELDEYIKNEKKNNEKFILHDGPPYANGEIHIGTALNKILKDMVIKYKTMKGFYSPYRPGWDTHGLPIEHQVSKTLGDNMKNMDKTEIRKTCEEYALKYVNIQREDFKRLGVRGEWNRPYLTLNPEYEASVLKLLKKLVKNENVYRSKKVVQWCPSCQTALADAEIEYEDLSSDSIYVKFPMKNEKDTFIIIWTTTPWTLPANMAIAVHPDYEYINIDVGNESWIMAKELANAVMSKSGITDWSVKKSRKGRELEGLKALHPFEDRESLIVLADYVELETGTGCVHTAPGHGEDDFHTGIKYGLDVYSPVNHKGEFTKEAGKYQGISVFSANKMIITDLKQDNKLVFAEKFMHSYPTCWRCHKPIIFRATEQWFISVNRNNLKDKVMKEIDNVRWIPDWGKNRISSMVKDRPDWCISRQRTWGIPIPAFYCEDCGKILINEEILDHVISIVAKEGSNAWFSKDEGYLLPEGYNCPECGGSHFRKEKDILDVWIDSGASFESVLKEDPNLRFPADLYLEGSDQHRGWFQSSIFLSTSENSCAPFKSVITHGFIRDGKGFKMSKSLGNVIFPQEVIKKYGADILRLWAASSDYRTDVNVSMDLIGQAAESYKKIRNTFRFILGNLTDFDPQKDSVNYKDLDHMDAWALSKFQRIINSVSTAFENYEFYKAMQIINKYLISDLSAVYLDVLKDRLYVDEAGSQERRSSQTVLSIILFDLAKMLSPILTFTSEEVYGYLHPTLQSKKTIQADKWPELNEELINEKLEEEWDKILEIKEKVNSVLENVRSEGIIGHSLDAKITISTENEEIAELLEKNISRMADIFIVSQFNLNRNSAENLEISVERAKGEKCARCWKYSEDLGKDAEFPDICPRCSNVLKKMK